MLNTLRVQRFAFSLIEFHFKFHFGFLNQIRAANLMHCSILSGMLQGSVSPFNINQAHQVSRRIKLKSFLVLEFN